jgi:hypothetical protein
MIFSVRLRRLILMIPLVLFMTGNRRRSKKSNNSKKLKRINSFRDENSIRSRSPKAPRLLNAGRSC